MMAAMKINEENISGTLLIDEPMAKHTSWRVGGPADVFYKPDSIESLQQFLQQLEANKNVTFVGLGSNVLVRDGGIRGIVVAPLGGLKRIERHEHLLCVDAGVSCSKFARYSSQNNYVGVDFLAGIPGTIGGAAAMNAGAFGSEIWEFISHITVIDRTGKLTDIAKNELTIDYREVSLSSKQWIVSIWFDLKQKTKEHYQKAEIKFLLEKRNNSQPIGLPSCGSVFRNPNNDYAARLIESCGLKGFCIGKACVSEKHANFIINTGDCLASDIESLIEKIQKTVLDDTGISLVLEAHIMGEHA